MKYTMLGLLLTCSMTAIAGPERHQDPTTEPMATIHFRDESRQYPILRMSYLNSYRCSEPRVVTFYDDPPNTSIKVDAQRPFTLRTTYIIKQNPGMTISAIICALPVITVSVEATKEYRISTNLVGEKCTVNVDVKQDDGTWLGIPDFVERKFKAPMFESQGFCAADENYKQFDKPKKQ